jgi:outer membrane protein insertion porin family
MIITIGERMGCPVNHKLNHMLLQTLDQKRSMTRLCAVIVVLMVLCGLPFQAVFAQVFQIKKIEIVGLERIDEGVVLNELDLEVGDTFDTARSAELIKKLYKTTFFKDISLAAREGVLVVSVQEKPAIGSIGFSGNESFDKDQLTKILRDVGLQEGMTFNEYILQKVKQELEQQYLSQGKYAVRIKPTVTPLERNRVAVMIDISEGKVATIQHIRILGNKAFTEAELLSQFKLNTGGILSWVNHSDRYSKQQLTADLEQLRLFYLNNGYLKFKIEGTQVSLSPDKKHVYITIRVQEGSLYRIGAIRFGGKMLQNHPDLISKVKLVEGRVYSEKEVTASEEMLTKALDAKGFLFAEVTVQKDPQEAQKKVDITFFVRSGKRVYVRRIYFVGNTKTQDQVLRRELLQMEGGFVSREKIEQSKQRLYQLGYISELNVETIPVPGTQDQVDLKYSLQETNTGHFTGGVGYGQAEGLMFNLGVSQDNFFGTGKNVSLNFDRSQAVTAYNAGYFDPYFTDNGVGFGVNGYYNETRLKQLAISNYVMDNKGFTFQLRVPVTLFDSLTYTAGFQYKRIKISDQSPIEIQAFTKRHGFKFNLVPVGFSWRHNKLDRALFPTSGWSNDIGTSVTIPGSQLTYATTSNTTHLYQSLWSSGGSDIVLHLKGFVGYGFAYGSLHELPFFENYYAGGTGSVRGFVENSIGPRDSQNNALGGHTSVLGSAELFLPKIFADSVGWRPGLFYDVGTVYGGEIKLSELRQSAGLLVQWISPLGPLSFSYGVPIRKFKNDELRGFNFSIGSNFYKIFD